MYFRLMALMGLLLAAAFLSAYRSGSKNPRPHVYLTTNVKLVLAKDWDAEANDPNVVERSYCFSYRSERDSEAATGFDWIVYDIQKPSYSGHATPYGLSTKCPAGMGYLHTHVATTCSIEKNPWGKTYKDCILGGIDAWDCQPSDQDQANIDRAWTRGKENPFDLIQCSRDVVVPFFPG